MPIRTIHREHHHFGWNNRLDPVATVAPGDALELELIDASAGIITPTSTAGDVQSLDAARANPLTGPVFVDGAEPGDTLWVEILDLQGSGWGWTAIIPGFGLLADEFPGPFLNLCAYDHRRVEFLPGVRLPARPFPGTIGVVPSQPGIHGAIPPRATGGNLDLRDLRVGSRIGLPVAVAGALFSAGDTHAAQGDGEVCGTAVESPMTLAVRFALEKGRQPRMPRVEVPGQDHGHDDDGTDAARVDPAGRGLSITTGVGPDLHEAARDAVRDMIDLLMQRHGMAAEAAYCLCSVGVNLRLSEIVNAPNWVVSASLRHDLFS